jgi:D-serine deaminase-like pyridoxal phosphate-dependent protein
MDAFGGGYGEVVSLDGAPFASRPIVDTLNQVHGRIVATTGSLERLTVGTRLRVLPNHACLTAAMFDRYYVLDGETIVEWPRLRG